MSDQQLPKNYLSTLVDILDEGIPFKQLEARLKKEFPGSSIQCSGNEIYLDNSYRGRPVSIVFSSYNETQTSGNTLPRIKMESKMKGFYYEEDREDE